MKSSVCFYFQYAVPAKDTTYACTAFEMPDLGGKHHMIEVRNKYKDSLSAQIRACHIHCPWG